MPPLEAKKGFKFGCDPELFILDASGKPVCATGIIPGTKEEPRPVLNGAIQADGFAAEFNIDPVDNFKDWNSNIASVVSQMEKFLPAGHTFSTQSSAVFDKELFDASPDVAKALGCSPDYNAWTGEVNPPPVDPENPYMRCSGGHIHIGWTEDQDTCDIQHVMNCRDLVKQLDWFLGAYSLRFDTDPTRRRLYGRAGACRYKPYGVEYRVLSSFWVLSRERRLAVWNRLQTAILDMRTQFIPDRTKGYENALAESINSGVMSKAVSQYRFPVSTIDHSYSRF